VYRKLLYRWIIAYALPQRTGSSKFCAFGVRKFALCTVSAEPVVLELIARVSCDSVHDEPNSRWLPEVRELENMRFETCRLGSTRLPHYMLSAEVSAALPGFNKCLAWAEWRQDASWEQIPFVGLCILAVNLAIPPYSWPTTRAPAIMS
jgi:hypothetical protein